MYSNTSFSIFTASTADISASEAQEPKQLQPLSRSQSIVFDEDKPIAASGTYNLDYLIAGDSFPKSNFGSGPSSRAPLTRSLKLPDPVPEAPTVHDEESPIPPIASYKWDPDNFENIDPFCTGGSKVANSPVLGRKEPRASSPRQPVRLEFDYSEDSGEAPRNTPPPKILGKKPGAKMPIRKPKLGFKKAPPPQTEQLDNAPVPALTNDIDEIPIPKGSYNFDPSKWDDPNINPFSSRTGIPNSPGLSRGSYSFDPDSSDDSIDPFKSSNKMGNAPLKATSFDKSKSNNDNENDNDNIVELEDHNQNKPAKNKKKPLKSTLVYQFQGCKVCEVMLLFQIVVKEKEAIDWKRKYEESRREVEEMRWVFSKDRDSCTLSHHTIQQLILEKDQALADLNSVEKSLADMFRRYEKMKDVLEGFRKVSHFKSTTLKILAEEIFKKNIKRLTLFFGFCLQNKEIEELTKICDELIAKMGKS
uniref:Uncharacterized LOC107585353 n=1 Tax=Sinocyclocheilus grahami TaxID=75366 RepID=A0A672NNV8_SINGR